MQSFLAAFLASLVEFCEALTVILPVHGWRGARPGTQASRRAAIGREMLGLFVDDRGFAVSILLWLALVLLRHRWLGVPA